MAVPFYILARAAVALGLFVPAVVAEAQVPTQCVEIERILVDACIDGTVCPSGQEGQNEMVSFRTGPLSIALGDLVADWPNNSWNGLVQNATTAALTAELDATIAACGHLLEPPAGVIPPGSRVLLVTSTAMCTAANSFTNLTDTVYLIFQAPGNTAGHFANQNNGSTISATPSGGESLRTLVLTHVPSGCSDTATYDRQLLPNVLGTYGGTSSQNDGATAVFTWPGVAQVSYVNYGCQAPIVPTQVTVDQVVGSLCGGGGTVQLQGAVSGPFTSVQWTGGSGTFSDVSALNTSYTAGPNDLGNVVLSLCATLVCGDPVCTTVSLPTGNAPVVTVATNGPTALCPGQSVTLTASGADDYLWNDQQTGPTITVTGPGTYSVTGTNACGSADAQITLGTATAPAVSISASGPTALCSGESVTLTASGADSYVWNGQQTASSITVSIAGTYTVIGTNACGSASAQVTVTVAQSPVVSIVASGPTVLCLGESVTFTATGATTYLWNTQQTSATITVSTAGTYSVVGTNSCGQASASTTVEVVDPSASFQPSVTAGNAPLSVVFTNTSGPGSYVWDLGGDGTSTATSPTHVFSEAGTFLVVLTVTDQGCTALAQATIIVTELPIGVSSLEVPNVFSPNGDRVNDQFLLRSENIASLSLTIYNRWGEKVGELRSARDAWDARSFAGELVPDGTYFYTLVATGADGVSYDRTGSITLIR